MMREISAKERARLWLNYGTQYNSRLFYRVVSQFGSLLEAMAAFSHDKERFSVLPDYVSARLREARQEGFIDRYLEQLEKKNIRFTYPGNERYPKLLSEIHDPPSVLYYIGRIEPDPELSIAVIGSRHPTKYGIEVAKRFGYELASAGALVVAGLAEGIDACAARGALDAKHAVCPTLAVLGCGVDVVYPKTNEKLYDEIIERGAVVSEFLPGTEPLKLHFPIRNRVMSGLAHGTLVIEAAERSGTSITAGYAHDQGREVFAVPGRIGDEMSAGPNGMISRGEAKAVFSTEDILSEFSCLHVPAETRPPANVVLLSSLSEDQRAICRLLKSGEMSFDELCDSLSLHIGAVNASLTELQFTGIVQVLPGRRYCIDTDRVKLKDI
ncbi:MAG: DNA-processing protein DprA [Eubacteriales bacterium]|jgi:DNA processing protein|nr:DNA-processing protein DprA [Eubacteriales bacterium]